MSKNNSFIFKAFKIDIFIEDSQSDDYENPTGQWNTLEIYAVGAVPFMW